MRTAAARVDRQEAPPVAHDLDEVTRRLVVDLHGARPAIFWVDLVASAIVGWTAFGFVVAGQLSPPIAVLAATGASLALYRGLSFIHELTHLQHRSIPGFETAWNMLFGVPLLLPSFTYLGVHQSHHSLSTYGTQADPEYLPFATSRRLIFAFSVQAAVLLPLALLIRFLVCAPVGLAWPRVHRWLETRASSFSMNPAYRRIVPPAAARKMRLWEAAILAAWAAAIGLMVEGLLPTRTVVVWYGVLALVSFLNVLRVLGAHDYDSAGTPLDRQGQLSDSIDTPGGPWTELWAPVGLRYHALHHYFPGIPYHNLGKAYRRIVASVPTDSLYRRSTSASLGRSLKRLYARATRHAAALRD
jgi:fatty acid desaturase